MKNNEVVSCFFDLVNERNLEKLEALLKENSEFYFPKTKPMVGKNRIIRFFKICSTDSLIWSSEPTG